MLTRVLPAISVLWSRLILQPLSRCSESQQSAALRLSATRSALVRPVELLNLKVLLWVVIAQYFWRRSSYRSTRFFILVSPEGHNLPWLRRTVAGQSPRTLLNLTKKRCYSGNRGSLAATSLWYCAATERDWRVGGRRLLDWQIATCFLRAESGRGSEIPR